VAQGVRVSCDESLNCHVVSWDAAVVTASANAAKATVLYYPPATSSPTDLMVMYNWAEIAAPVYLPSTGRTYLAAMHRPDSTVGGSVATHTDVASYAAVLDITSYAKEGTAYSPGTYQEARPVAGIGYTQYSGFQDETTGMFIGTAVNRTSLVGQCNACVDGDDLVFASTTKVGPGSIAVEAIRLTPNDPWAMGSVSDGESVYGGVCGCIDANGFCEFGQIEAPSLYLTDGGAAGTSLNGAYNYIAVLELVDTFGNSHFSKCSLPSSFTVPNGHMVNVVSTSSFFTVGSARRLGDAGVSYAVLHVYRTQVGQTQYYLVCTLKALKSITSFSDTMSDTTLAAQPEPYRQPGTPGTALDRNPSLMAKHAVKHKDRLFYCNGSTVYYSSFQVGGEAYWFNPAFSFEVPGGTGDITALGSMDGVLVIFKADSVFVVDGDGPGENGGNGSEFTPPRQIMTEHGCTYARSLISTPVGLMFRSGIGIMLLDRSLQVQFLGKTVVDTCDAYPYDRGAVYDVDNRRALFLMADSVQANGLVARTANSVVVCYDIYSSSWSTWRIASNDGTVPAGGGGSYDPTVMALSGWWIDYAGPTWAGTASAGTSAAHDLADSANTAASGAALNGHGTIAYSGAQKTVSTYKLGDIFANTPGVGIDAGTITILFKANSAPAPDASPYNDPMLFGSYASGYLTIGFNSSGVYPSFFGGAYAPCAPIAAATGVWNCVQIRFNSTSTQYRVNGGAWTTAAAYALPATPAESVSIAVSDGQFGTNYFDGTIAAIMTNDTKLSDADCDNLLTYLSGRYLVSIGAPLVGPPTPDGYGFNDICLANVGGSRKVFLNNGYVPHYLDESDSSDVYFYNPYTIETGWIRLDSAQDRIRVSDFLMLAKSQSPHDLTISVAYDYSPTYSYSKTWTAAKIAGMTLEQLELQIPGEARQAVRFKIQDSANADSVTYPMGTSKGPRILALTAKVGRRGGGAKLPADNKG
jgi:hypothetical protein